MRPITLEFSGLNSYREEQRVDFTSLLGGGVFGIFGPTGSGKSTVLDAITLALYGTVERADRNTGGIINHAERRLSVRFTFALADADGKRLYRVERSYRRDGDAVRSGPARLVEMTAAGEQVLADRDITERVEAIVGLTAKDFTRAVVLPQGKFAEFLTLGNADRREMLERIFSLSDYGDRLNQRLKARMQGVETRLQFIEGEQQGQGDASAEALAAASEQEAAAGAKFAAATTDYRRLTEQHREGEEIWRLQQEEVRLQRDRERWQEQEPSVQEQREELMAARRAEQLRRPLVDLTAARQAAAAAAERLTETATALQAAQAAEAEATAAQVQARERQQTESPGLAERRVQLAEAVKLAEAEQSGAATVAELEGRVIKGQSLIAQAEHEIATRSEQAAQAQAEQTALVARLGDLKVPAERRRQVQQSLVARSQLQQAEEHLTVVSRRRERRSQELATAEGQAEAARRVEAEITRLLADQEAALRHLEGEPPEQEAELTASAEWLGKVQEYVQAVLRLDTEADQSRQALAAQTAEGERRRAAQREREAAHVAAQAQLEQCRTRREAAEAACHQTQRQLQAASLATALAPGEPCPVCGSSHHPHPASSADQAAVVAADVAAEEARAAQSAAEAWFEETRRALTAAQVQAEAEAARAAGAEEALQRAAAALAAGRERLPAAWRDRPAAELPELVTSAAGENQRREQRLVAWRRQVEAARTQRDDQAKGAREAALAAATAAEALAAAGRANTEAEGDLVQAAAGVQERRAELDAALGDLAAEQLTAESQRIEAADATAAHLQQQLSDLAQAQTAREQELQQWQNQHREYAQLLQERLAQHTAAQQQLRSDRERLLALAGAEPPGPQLTTVNARLAELEGEEARATQLAEAARRRQGGLEVAAGAATREQELADQRAAQLDALVVSTLAAVGFPDADTAQAALRPASRQEELAERIRLHEQAGHTLQSRLSEIAAALTGKRWEAAAWAELEQRLAAARQAEELAREERARAAHVHGELQGKHRRWQELESERKGLATRQGYLEELQRLLRGNALVEFLAEEQLSQVAQTASERLGTLTRYRYALEVDAGGGFLIRDDGNGGVRRPVKTLSGGETFLTSLALALALSAQIQLRGRYPLEFFFLDEGFGSLDPELLNLVVDTLERLHFERLNVGVISHVPELRQRIQRRLIVEAAEIGGRGSQLVMEMA